MKIKYLLILIITIYSTLNMYKSDKEFSSIIQIDERSVGKNNMIEGEMNINGEMYDAKCHCDTETQTILEKDEKCQASKLSIIAERDGQGANYEEIKNLVGDKKEINFVKITSASFKCLDGRNSKGILGTPGGDAGEFILALSVYEDLIGKGKRLSQDDIHVIFAQYLSNKSYDKFYMCTDDMAISHLERELSVEGLNIHNPRSQLLSELYNLISKPENIGDLNMKMMLKYPEQFSIRKELVIMFLNSFYKILWNKGNDLSQKVELEILTGDHKESAFVEVRSSNTCLTEQLAPLIKTKNKSSSVFVNHLDAVSHRRYQLSLFFAELCANKSTSIDPLIFFEKLIQQGYKSLENTGSYISKGLPFYTLNLA